jgi:NAD(P)-dependent dehydrogenase (short-subunit alcohol dehydrogenase family)
VGPFLTTKACYSQIKKSEKAFLINFSSNVGTISEDGSGGNLAYRTSKTALNMITVDLASELAAEKITFVALSPGWVQTKMTNLTGPAQLREAVENMIKVIESLEPSETPKFLHRKGHEIGW